MSEDQPTEETEESLAAPEEEPFESPLDDRFADALFESVSAQIAQERGPRAWLRERSTRARAALLLAAIGGTWALLLAVTGAGPRLLETPLTPAWIASLVVLLGLGAVAGAAALRPAFKWRFSPTKERLIVGGLLAGALTAMALVTDGSLGSVGSMRCLMVGFVASLPVFGAAVVLDRAPERGLAFGALLAGLTGGLVVTALCPHGPIAHVVGQHFGVVALGALALGAAGKLLERRRT